MSLALTQIYSLRNATRSISTRCCTGQCGIPNPSGDRLLFSFKNCGGKYLQIQIINQCFKSLSFICIIHVVHFRIPPMEFQLPEFNSGFYQASSENTDDLRNYRKESVFL